MFMFQCCTTREVAPPLFSNGLNDKKGKKSPGEGKSPKSAKSPKSPKKKRKPKTYLPAQAVGRVSPKETKHQEEVEDKYEPQKVELPSRRYAKSEEIKHADVEELKEIERKPYSFGRAIRTGHRKKKSEKEKAVLRRKVREKWPLSDLRLLNELLKPWQGMVRKKNSTGWAERYYCLYRLDHQAEGALFHSNDKEKMENAIAQEELEHTPGIKRVVGLKDFEIHPTEHEDIFLVAKNHKVYHLKFDVDNDDGKDGRARRDEFAQILQNYLYFYQEL